jgi:carbamoyl-phosphate synthase large subunit
MNILITGIGGAIGLSVLKSLKMEFGDKYKLIGTDSSPLTPTFYMKKILDKSYLIPTANDDKYPTRLLEICKEENIDVILPCTDHELLPLSEMKDLFLKIGVKVIVSPSTTLQICRDKWLTYQTLHKYLPIAKTALPSYPLEDSLQSVGLPAVIKPREGWGSRDIYKVHTVNETQALIQRIKNPILQKWVDGEEYTIDGFTDNKGKLIYAVPRKRIKKFLGLSSIGMTVKDSELINVGKNITQTLKIIGPFNYQVCKTTDGRTSLIEINPRFAGTCILSTKAGINIPALTITAPEKRPLKLGFKENLIMYRFFDELYIEKDELLYSS